ncbi:MAG: hypothetical protein HOW73_35700 [Polyangiaceae bacterium]|nr:hypothetical protein [Polyangiaceae bacterium]
MKLRLVLIGIVGAAWSCTATPLPVPPVEYELDVEKLEVTDQPLVFEGNPGAVTPGDVEIRITPGPPDGDPVVEDGTGTVAADGSFTILVESPLPNIFFFEAIEEDEDVFFGAVRVDAAGNVEEADPGPDGDDDGSPDAIDCAPTDPERGGRRC